MDVGLIVAFAGIVVAGLAGVLGVWMERDREAPPRWAYVFSALIGVAAIVEMTHAIAQAREDAVTEQVMVDVLEKLAEISENSDDPALAQFVGAELSRSNPKVMKRLEKRIAAKGGDPTAVKRRAAQGRRASAGLPARKGAKAGGGAAGEAATTAPGETAARTKAPGEGKVGKNGGGASGAAPGAVEAVPVEGAAPAPAAPAPAVEGKAGKAAGEGKTGKGKSP